MQVTLHLITAGSLPSATVWVVGSQGAHPRLTQSEAHQNRVALNTLPLVTWIGQTATSALELLTKPLPTLWLLRNLLRLPSWLNPRSSVTAASLALASNSFNLLLPLGGLHALNPGISILLLNEKNQSRKKNQSRFPIRIKDFRNLIKSS